MKGYGKIAVQIISLLRGHPRGMTITGISQALSLNRNSVAKYLEILVTSGQVERQRVGRAKIFFLSQRVPLSAMLNLSSDMILILDEESRIWFVNDHLLAFAGKPREEVLGKDPRTVLPGIFSDPEIRAWIGGNLPEEVRKDLGITVAKEKRYFTVSLVPTTLEDGSRGITIIAGDITERKQAEEALTRSERRYRSLFENLLDGYMYCRLLYDDGRPGDFIYLDVNPAFQRITGLRDVIGKKVTEVIPGIRESNPELFDLYDAVVKTGRPDRFETYIPALDALYSVSVFSPEKEHFVVIFEDITRRKATEESLKEHLRFFQELLDRVPVPVFYKDADGIYLGCNRAFELYSRKTRDEILHRRAAQILPSSLAKQFEAMDARALETGQIQSLESVYPYPDGSKRDFVVFKNPFLGRDGSRAGTVGTIIDISGTRQIEDPLRKRIREIEGGIGSPGPCAGREPDEEAGS